MKHILSAAILSAAFMVTLPAAAQNPQQEQRLTPQLMARLFPAGVNSPEYNKDGSVTFRFQAENAKKVELECQMFSGNRPMTKN